MRISYGRWGLVVRPHRSFYLPWRQPARFSHGLKKVEPLRILYCGSDEFSAVSLEKLHAEHQTNPDLIAGIDVVAKAAKPSGRGLKILRDVPIKKIAERLALPLHEIPTFTGWEPPLREGRAFNLVIAVSFGLLVPPRILKIAKYGGINLHPSMLPEFRGPAPLQHTILNGLTESGVTLQTLHEKHFDRGKILGQDCFELPADASSSVERLRDFTAEKAANLLIRSLREHVIVPPLQLPEDLIEREASYACKTTPEHAHVDWKNWEADRIIRTQCAIGPTWNRWHYSAQSDQNSTLNSLRVIWHNLQVISDIKISEPAARTPGMPSVIIRASGASIGGMWTCDGHFLSPNAVTVEGRKKGWPGNSVKSMQYFLSLANGDKSSSAVQEHKAFLA